MQLRDAYYAVKPAIPQQLRLALRRVHAGRIRQRSGGSWPIAPASHQPPDGWPGWPEGRTFAFVLTHDVEGRKGLNRCREVARLEMSLGLRSSFNFVPEGEYETPEALRMYLHELGFEIGVHDLHHDGRLYRSRETFLEHAQSINRYLATWKAVGFRSAFMLHNLTWLQDLDILYDASTFDTDPFEPQPDGMNTIYPFWVSREDGSGYVELPYTLTQDSTLFNVLEEETNGIWKEKLDWVARHGGLALVNVHPDYMNFSGQRSSLEYSAELYRDFLAYAATRYAGDAWFALPHEVATYVARFRPSPPSNS